MIIKNSLPWLVAFFAMSGNLYAQTNMPLITAEKGLSKQWYYNLYHDNQRAVYHGEQLKTIGMPVGGIAAGQLYLRGDGTFGRWWIANNAYNTGYGAPQTMTMKTPFGATMNCYQTYTPESFVDQGFRITVKSAAGKAISRRLDKSDLDNISFIGEYPEAWVNYADQRQPLPVSVTMKAFSPFIPLDAKESATPGTYMVFAIKNTSNQPLNVNLTGWLQNMVCMELKDKAKGTLRNRAVAGNKSSSLVLDLVPDTQIQARTHEIIFDDFESGNFDNWTVTGNAFSNKPVKGTVTAHNQQQVGGYSGDYLVNSFVNTDDATGAMLSKEFTITEDHINFLIGGGNKPGKTCINLLVDGKVAFTETGGDNETLEPGGWDVSAFKGKKARLQIVDNDTGPWGHINIDRIVFSNAGTGRVQHIESHPYFGNVALTVLDPRAQVITNTKTHSSAEAEKNLGEKLVGSVGTDMQLAPGQQREVLFMLTWYFPNRPLYYDGGGWAKPLNTRGPAIGNIYSNWYSSAVDVAGWMVANRLRLTSLTDLFHDSYYRHTTLPYWLNQRIMMPVSTLATETCQWWANGKFWAWEGVGSCDGTCTHVWNYEQALAHLFPDLERNIRERTDFGTSFLPDGGIMTRNGTDGVKIDGHAGGILKSYREYLMSDNPYFLTRNWENIKKATRYIIRKDAEDGKTDGIIEGEQPNTYDVAFYGANTFVGSLYLASLRAAEKMALIMHDRQFADTCRMIYRAGEQQTEKRLWDGSYFTQDVDLEKYPQSQYGNGCLADQLFGDTWTHLLDMDDVYPHKMVQTALRSVWNNNWTKDVGAYNKIHEPGRFYAGAGEPGLLIATWPKGGYLQNGVIYKDEVWTGIEYQVATNMIYENMLDEGLSLVRSVHERYSPEKHNPWDEIECGDHYARALASWGVLMALQDYQYDGPAGSLSFAPKLTPANFESFFTTAAGWGNLVQKRNQGIQVNEVQLKYGQLRLTQFSCTLPDKADAKEVTLTINGKPVQNKWERLTNEVRISGFDKELYAGDVLKVQVKD